MTEQAVMGAHPDIEAYLMQSGLKHTILREGIYNESYPHYLGHFDAHNAAGTEADREVIVAGDGGNVWVARNDLGEGSARILRTEGDRSENKTLSLSGDQAIPLRELAKMITEIMGWKTSLKVEETSIEEYTPS
ncbi:hypothetical protein MMC12_001500 [Toensbergia leucococca]|nr:hypothetical protein [Toensbergia leucococca]